MHTLVVIDLYSYTAFNFCFKVCPGMVWRLYLLLKRREMQALQTEQAIECLIENAKKGNTAAEQCKEDPSNKECREMAEVFGSIYDTNCNCSVCSS